MIHHDEVVEVDTVALARDESRLVDAGPKSNPKDVIASVPVGRDGFFTRADLQAVTGRSHDWCCRKLREWEGRGLLAQRSVKRKTSIGDTRWVPGYRVPTA